MPTPLLHVGYAYGALMVRLGSWRLRGSVRWTHEGPFSKHVFSRRRASNNQIVSPGKVNLGNTHVIK